MNAIETLRDWVIDRPILWVSLTGLVALIFGIGIGASDEAPTGPTLEDDITRLRARLAMVRSEAEDTRRELEQAREQARTADERATQEAQAEIAGEREQLAQMQTENAQREEELSSAQQTLEQSTIPDGTWQLGRDYEAGLYRAPGGGGCYWELLRQPSGPGFGHIIDNGSGRNQTLQIDSPFFSTQDCGEWTKIG